jgi:hypothetical protein
MEEKSSTPSEECEGPVVAIDPIDGVSIDTAYDNPAADDEVLCQNACGQIFSYPAFALQSR